MKSKPKSAGPKQLKALKKKGKALLRSTKGVKVSRLPKRKAVQEKLHDEAPGED